LHLDWARFRGSECLRVSGFPPRALDALRVYPTEVVDAARTSNLEPIDGEFHVDGHAVAFVPRFPFVAGISYTVMGTDIDDLGTLTITRPAHDGVATTRVVAIHPTATEIPRNHLRLYVHFSAPMSEGRVESHLHVVRADTGEPLVGALLPMGPELWDPNRRRVTVLFDPARIKRGLAPHEQAGYPLQTGVPVEVFVDRRFTDADGLPLVADARRRYEVGGDVRSRVDPYAWLLTLPVAHSRAPLVASFDRPLDHALLQHCLLVAGSDGEPVEGQATIAEGETSWRFTPAAPWLTGRHTLVVDGRLEDLAGNSVTRVFDRELDNPAHDPLPTDHVVVEFSVS
jgi:hypothetical protein